MINWFVEYKGHCLDCKWCEPYEDKDHLNLSWCRNIKVVGMSPITGVASIGFCSSARSYGKCGYRGKYFEPK